MSNPTAVLRLCCVVIGVVTINLLFASHQALSTLSRVYQNSQGVGWVVGRGRVCKVILMSNQNTVDVQLGF